jgi:hypothetical protein
MHQKFYYAKTDHRADLINLQRKFWKNEIKKKFIFNLIWEITSTQKWNINGHFRDITKLQRNSEYEFNKKRILVKIFWKFCPSWTKPYCCCFKHVFVSQKGTTKVSFHNNIENIPVSVIKSWKKLHFIYH